MEYAFYNFQKVSKSAAASIIFKTSGHCTHSIHNKFIFVLTGMRPLDLKVATLLRSSSRQS